MHDDYLIIESEEPDKQYLHEGGNKVVINFKEKRHRSHLLIINEPQAQQFRRPQREEHIKFNQTRSQSLPGAGRDGVIYRTLLNSEEGLSLNKR